MKLNFLLFSDLRGCVNRREVDQATSIFIARENLKDSACYSGKLCTNYETISQNIEETSTHF